MYTINFYSPDLQESAPFFVPHNASVLEKLAEALYDLYDIEPASDDWKANFMFSYEGVFECDGDLYTVTYDGHSTFTVTMEG